MLTHNKFTKLNRLLFLALFLGSFIICDASNAEQKQTVFTSIDGGFIDLAEWKGEPYLVVNTASRCAFTKQYAGLQELYDRYRENGFKVLAVPSDDFNQELDTDAEVKDFCELNYGVDMPMTTLQAVKGANSHQFYQNLKATTGFVPSWNFNKVLIGSDGQLVNTWGETSRPLSNSIIQAIEKQLFLDE